jgi:hypothetical protein
LNKKLDGRQKCLRCNSRNYQINLIIFFKAYQ